MAGDGVEVAGLIIDDGPVNSPVLMQMGVGLSGAGGRIRRVVVPRLVHLGADRPRLHQIRVVRPEEVELRSLRVRTQQAVIVLWRDDEESPCF